ncbi:hypothetical protein C0J52_14237, partial [Blattella germanica]
KGEDEITSQVPKYGHIRIITSRTEVPAGVGVGPKRFGTHSKFTSVYPGHFKTHTQTKYPTGGEVSRLHVVPPVNAERLTRLVANICNCSTWTFHRMQYLLLQQVKYLFENN